MGTTNSERSLFLLRALVRSLGHRIRTPLSVIHNDLFYLRSVLNDPVCDAGLLRSKEIEGILSEVSACLELPQNISDAERNKVIFDKVVQLIQGLPKELGSSEVIENPLSFSLRLPAIQDLSWGIRFNSFSYLIVDTLGIDSLRAPCIDALLEALSATTIITIEDQVKVIIQV